MSYIDGFVVAVPTANREAYLAMARGGQPLFREFGASRMVEAWGDEVPRGKHNDLYGAVQAGDDETVVFSWIEYPDRTTRDAANGRMISDPRMQALGDMPFDGQRMIFAGFEPLIDLGSGAAAGYIDGSVAPVPEGNRDAYRQTAEVTAALFLEYGAVRVVEAWGDDVADGKRTGFRRATLAGPGEQVVFSWIEWPSKDARDSAWARLMEDPRMHAVERPFDGSRMMHGGFMPILDA